MVKQVIWSFRAKDSLKEILSYWTSRNKSATYSKKLNKLISEAVKLIGQFPNSGKLTDDLNVRVKIVRVYLIYYEQYDDGIQIIQILDGRRDPDNLKYFLEI
jgi:plasmid stabilization system protein ParE